MGLFKDFVNKDIKSTFININEFGEEVTIDGETVNVVIDNDKLQELKLQNREGLHTSELLFYVSKEVMPFYPRPEQRFTFNGIGYYVVDVSEDVDIFEVTAEVAES